jgi:hypothetical protein
MINTKRKIFSAAPAASSAGARIRLDAPCRADKQIDFSLAYR